MTDTMMPHWRRLQAARICDLTAGTETQDDNNDWNHWEPSDVDWVVGNLLSGRRSPPVLLKEYHSEGGTKDATVTTSDTFGDSWDQVTITAGNIFKYNDTPDTYGGVTHIECNTSAGVNSFAYWNVTSTRTINARVYLMVITAATQIRFLRFLNSANALVAAIGLNTSRNLLIIDSNGTVQATAGSALTASRWYRIDITIDIGTTTTSGDCTVRWYADTDSWKGVSESSITATGEDFRGDTDTIERAAFGMVSTGNLIRMDDIALGSTDQGDWIGPSTYRTEHAYHYLATSRIDANGTATTGFSADTFIIPRTGIYDIEGHCEWAADNTGTSRGIRLAKNHNTALAGTNLDILSGGTTLSDSQILNDTGLNVANNGTIAWMGPLNAGDTIYMETQKASAGNVTLNDGSDLWWAHIVYIGPNR